ncbi:hypothetical protein [Chamaesiphon sp. VAR_69_metabat_338]|uniref:hypothetical protein n=1 Tax=Chamaesiphon sp. VAR_69_metabat_338 TaxID=2964704 RepID=UPI00286E6402|nr:hypothetical protein [Chamaesiphon sp. VAR_69_metabat_338]
MLKLVLVSLAVAMATSEVGGTCAAAATHSRSIAISSNSIKHTSTNSPADRRWLAIAKCTLKRYRRPHLRS